jgi:hypothetical protein
LERGEREGEREKCGCMLVRVGVSTEAFGFSLARCLPPANNVILSHSTYSPGTHILHFLVLSMLLHAAGVVSSQHPPPSAPHSLSQRTTPCIRGVKSFIFNLITQNNSLSSR